MGTAAACERLIRYLCAEQTQAISQAADFAVAAEHGVMDAGKLTGDELVVMMALTPGQARYRVSQAQDLVQDLPGIHLLLRQGRLDLARAARISEKMHADLDPGSPE